jgi:microcompartment protein CcmL/EutN
MGASLGIIETRGFVAAVEAADAAVKTAEVSIIGCRLAGAGLVSIFLQGDVSSVTSAVASGVASGGLVGEIVSSTVIARTGEGLEYFLSADEEVCAVESPVDPPIAAKTLLQEIAPAEADLARMSVGRLRTLARVTANLSLDKAEIKNAGKQQLMAAILAAHREKKL